MIDKISNDMFTDINLYFILSLCFCFSVTWFLINVISSYLITLLVQKLLNVKTEPHEIYIASIIYSIIYLSIIIAFATAFTWTFTNFIIISYLFIAIRIIWSFITTPIINRLMKKAETQSNNY